MRSHYFRLTLLIAAATLAAASFAFANGFVSERRAGGIAFKKTDTIAIASEELYISRNEIRVSYVYQSKAPAAQTVTISFPMPEVPLDDGGDATDVFFNDNIPDTRNYMNFAVQSDGRPVETRLTERALFKGKDVTARLQRAGVPLTPVKDREQALAPVPIEVKKALLKDGLLIGEEPHYTPMWTYQVLFEWQQTFPPGPTKVDIKYRPFAGDSSDFGVYFEKGAGVKKYCADPAFRAALAKRRGKVELAQVGYILKTAKYWSGPIGKFRLVVDKGEPGSLVAFCPVNSKKISDTQFEWTATNFVPDRDIEVAFFSAQENE